MPKKIAKKIETEESLSELKKAELDCLLNEFNALREEFISRLNTENILVLGSLTFLGTILSVALKDFNTANYEILLVIPILMPLFGIYYLNQRLSNTAIGLYVKNRLKKQARELLGRDIFQWEDYVRETTSLIKELTIFVFVLFIFSIPGIAVLFIAFHLVYSSNILINIVAWWTGTVISLIFSILWSSLFWGWFGKKD